MVRQLSKQIAARLGVGLKTIKAHRARVMQKMQTKRVADLVRAAWKLELQTPMLRTAPAATNAWTTVGATLARASLRLKRRP